MQVRLTRPTDTALYPILVHRLEDSIHASFNPASRLNLCASLVLHLHQVEQGTYTPKQINMPGTQKQTRDQFGLAFVIQE